MSASLYAGTKLLRKRNRALMASEISRSVSMSIQGVIYVGKKVIPLHVIPISPRENLNDCFQGMDCQEREVTPIRWLW